MTLRFNLYLMLRFCIIRTIRNGPGRVSPNLAVTRAVFYHNIPPVIHVNLTIYATKYSSYHSTYGIHSNLAHYGIPLISLWHDTEGKNKTNRSISYRKRILLYPLKANTQKDFVFSVGEAPYARGN